MTAGTTPSPSNLVCLSRKTPLPKSVAAVSSNNLATLSKKPKPTTVCHLWTIKHNCLSTLVSQAPSRITMSAVLATRAEGASSPPPAVLKAAKYAEGAVKNANPISNATRGNGTCIHEHDQRGGSRMHKLIISSSGLFLKPFGKHGNDWHCHDYVPITYREFQDITVSKPTLVSGKKDTNTGCSALGEPEWWWLH